MTGFSWLVSIAALLGVILNIKKNAGCFVIWAATNFAWTIIDLEKGIPAQATLQAVYFALSIYGLYKWTRCREKTQGSAPDPKKEESCHAGKTTSQCL